MMKTITQLIAEKQKITEGRRVSLSPKEQKEVRLITELVYYLERNASEEQVEAQLAEVERQLAFLRKRFSEFELPKGVDEKKRKPYFEKIYRIPLLRLQRQTLRYLLEK